MSNFTALIQGERPVLVDFFATWCGPCKTMEPLLAQVKAEIGASASIIKIDVDKNPAAASKYQVQGVPTLILFKKGVIVWRQSGVVQPAVLTQLIQQHL